MTTLDVTTVASGKIVDTITTADSQVSYSTGLARNMVESRARARGITEPAAVAELDGWSNGYLKFSQTQAGQPVRALSHSDVRAFFAAFDRAASPDPSAADIESYARAAGADTHPGGEELKHYWTKGEGLALWADSPDPWTTLYDQLITKVKDPEKTKRIVSAWYQIVFHGPVGWRKGKNPNGPG